MALSSRVRQFCCCFAPVFGVLALSYFWIISGLVVAITGWLQVRQAGVYSIASRFTIALFLHAIIFTSLSVIGIYGVAVGLLKRPGLVLGYLILLAVHLLFSFVGGTFFLMMVTHVQTQDEISECLSYINPVAQQLCYTPITLDKGGAIAIYGLSWILELYTCVMAFFHLEDLKQYTANPDLEKKPKRLVDPLTIGEPSPIPNFKPATMSMLMGNNGFPISAVHSLVTPGPKEQDLGSAGVQQHTWAPASTPTQTPRNPRKSPPTTPVISSLPDLTSGRKPLLLLGSPKPSSQPSSPHVIPPIEISTSPLHQYGLGSAGLSTSYTFSAPVHSFGSQSTPTTPLTATQAAYVNSSSTNNRF